MSEMARSKVHADSAPFRREPPAPACRWVSLQEQGKWAQPRHFARPERSHPPGWIGEAKANA